jgi:hypothetical protein
MGTWGFGSFENDTALDWVGEFGDEPSVNELLCALNGILEEDGHSESRIALMEYLDDEDACPIAVVAAEVIAAMRGHASPEFPDQLKAWVAANRSAATVRLVDTAVRALQKARSNEIFLSCFCDDDDIRTWQSEVDGLINRLKKSAS